MCRLDTRIGQAFAEFAVHWVDGGEVHGTLQIGQPAWIAERTGCTVVSDLRSRDVAAGGQGAPLVSALDVLWLRRSATTWAALQPGRDRQPHRGGALPIAFDTGPVLTSDDRGLPAQAKEAYTFAGLGFSPRTASPARCRAVPATSLKIRR